MPFDAISMETWDVVVVGAGIAGLTTAIAACECGARTVVLEKAPNIKWTNTSRAGGISWALNRDLPNSVDERIQQAVQFSEGRCDVVLLKEVLEKYDGVVDWIERLGLRRDKRTPQHATQKGSIWWLGFGAGLNKQLLSLAQKMGCQIGFNTKAFKLLVDEKGRVSGITVKTAEGLRDFMAGAVVLATAGFQANQEMLMKYFGAEVAHNVKLTGSPYSTGDGHIMAKEIGAKLMNMDQWHCRTVDKSWVPRSAGQHGPVRELQDIYRYFIFINRLGQRFIDEGSIVNTSPSNAIACSIARQPGMAVAFIFDEKIKAINPKRVEGYRPPGIIMKADTLEELAEKIEVPFVELKKTMKEFNNAVKDGKALSLDISKTGFAVKIETPPYYAIYPVWCGLNCTMGGVKVTPEAKVVDRDDESISGLYAAGEMVSGLFGGRYHATKGGAVYYRGNYQVTSDWLACCLVLGAMAGRGAAKEAMERKKM
jgi:succinate dehydrogenase/fumarate reductase flavoprotein subunit